MKRSWLLAPMLLIASPEPAGAQQRGFQGRLEVTGAAVRVRSADLGDTVIRHGVAPGFRANLRWAAVGIEIRYAQGSVDDGGDSRDFAEGVVLASLTPRPFLSLLVGTRAHALTREAVTRRWLFWTAEARFRSPPFARETAWLYGGLWLAAGSVNGVDGGGRGHGLESGIVAEPRGLPLAVRLAYRLDEGRIEDGARRSTVEQVTLGVGYSF